MSEQPVSFGKTNDNEVVKEAPVSTTCEYYHSYQCECHEDALAPSRGILIGLLIATVFWLSLGWLVFGGNDEPEKANVPADQPTSLTINVNGDPVDVTSPSLVPDPSAYSSDSPLPIPSVSAPPAYGNHASYPLDYPSTDTAWMNWDPFGFDGYARRYYDTGSTVYDTVYYNSHGGIYWATVDNGDRQRYLDVNTGLELDKTGPVERCYSYNPMFMGGDDRYVMFCNAVIPDVMK